MRKRKSLLTVIAMLLTLCSITLQVNTYAAEQTIPDPKQEGTISITLTYGEEKTPAAGVELLLYKIADLSVEDGVPSYTYTESYKDFEVEPEKAMQPDYIEKLQELTGEKQPEAMEATADEAGKLAFEPLLPGIYLVTQKDAGKAKIAVSSFVVSLPHQGADGFSYEIDASPKVVVAEKPDTPDKPNRPNKPWQTGAAKTSADRTALVAGPCTCFLRHAADHAWMETQ